MKHHRRVLQGITIAAAVLATGPMLGCSALGGSLAGLFSGNGAGRSRGPDADGRPYAGPACDEVLYSLEQSDYNPLRSTETEDPRLQVLLGICHRGERTNTTGHHIVQNPRVRGPLYLARHEAFDDRRNDALEAALLLDQCATTECRRIPSYQLVPGPSVVSAEDGEAGMLLSYAALLDLDELRADLAALDLDPAAREAFVERVTVHQRRLTEAVDAMSEAKRELVAGIPVDVRRERAQYFETHAALYAELDALRASRGEAPASDEDLAALRELRHRYAAQCEGPECRFEPFYVDVTRELVVAHLVAQSPLDVMVESQLLTEPETLGTGMAEAIFRAQSEAVRAATEARETKREAESKGLDEASVAALVGDVVPLEVDSHALWWPQTKVIRYDELIDTKSVGRVQSYVSSVKVKGDRAEVRFKGSSYKSTEAYDCRRTGRIARIDRDGRVEYEQSCKHKQVTRRVPPIDPIVVPASEVAGLRPGELLDAYVRGAEREGRVVEVHAGDPLQLVQWLGDRFGG